jgi:general secretion pathway protein K
MPIRYLANNRGMALVITLFVVALVTVLVLEYHFDASVEIDLAANFASDVQAYHLALSGVNFARALLLRDDPQADGPEDLWYRLGLIPACFPPQQLLTLAGEAGSGPLPTEGTEEIVDTPSSDEGCVRLRIVDEQSKLPINALMPTGGNQEPNPTWLRIFEQFFASFQIDQDILDALVDWIDQNDEPHGVSGAENAYYEALEHPYTAPDGPMRALGDLRLVRGFDYETLAKFFPGVPPERIADVDLGSNGYLVAYPPGQEAKVNLNTANGEVLQALFDGLQGGSGNTADLVEEIIAKRQETQFGELSEVSELITDGAVKTQLNQVAGVKSTYFRVESTGVVGIIQKKAVAVVKRGQQTTSELVYFKVE